MVSSVTAHDGTVNGTRILKNMPSCAYQFRLSTSMLTTNGNGLISQYREDTRYITIRLV